MFTNLFNYEENENVVEFIEDENIETFEELDTFVDKVKTIVVNIFKISFKVVKTVGMTVLLSPFIVYSAGKAIIKGVCNKIERKRKTEKATEIILEQLRDYGIRTGKIK